MDQQIIKRALEQNREVLLEHELLDLLEALQLPVPRHRYIPLADVGKPGVAGDFSGQTAVLKVVSEKILHKTDLGGVAFVNPTTDETLAAAAARMIAGLPAELRGSVLGFVLEERIPFVPGPGRELLLGLRHSEEFGPVFTVGFGGTYVEALSAATREDQSTIIFQPQITSPQLLEQKLNQAFFFRWTAGQIRGVDGVCTPAVLSEQIARWIDAMQQICRAVAAAGRSVAELEFNPLVWSERWIPVDALLRLGPPLRPPAVFPSANLQRALRPKTVGIMGVSTKINVGRIILRCMLEGGFPAERVFPIRDDLALIDGVPCVASLADLPQPVDLLVLAVAAAHVPAILEDVFAARRARAVLLIPGGMGETEGGKAIEHQILELIARDPSPERPAVIGNNSLGVVSRPACFDSLFIPRQKLPRQEHGLERVALISQSGAFIITQLNKLDFLSPNFQISLGNQIDARISHFLEALADEAELTTYALYIEGFKPDDGARLAGLIRRLVQKGKDLVVYKAGRSQLGRTATMGHTASIAGDYRIFASLMRDAGALVADSFADFCDLVRLSTTLHDRQFTGRRVGLMSNAGYEVVGMADNHQGSQHRLQASQLCAATTERIAVILAEARIERLVNITNPLDLTPMASDAVHAACMQAILDDPQIDAAVFGNVPLTSMVQSLPHGICQGDVFDAPAGYANRAIQIFGAARKPFVVVIDAGRYYDPLADYLQSAGLPVFRSGDRATRLLGCYIENQLRRE